MQAVLLLLFLEYGNEVLVTACSRAHHGRLFKHTLLNLNILFESIDVYFKEVSFVLEVRERQCITYNTHPSSSVRLPR
jgi:hypothetical protein